MAQPTDEELREAIMRQTAAHKRLQEVAPGWPDADTCGIDLSVLGDTLEARAAADREVLHLLRLRAGWDDGQ